MNRRYSVVLTLVIVAATVNGCGSGGGNMFVPGSGAKKAGGKDGADSVSLGSMSMGGGGLTYDAVKGIFQRSCQPCHTGGGAANWLDYDVAAAAAKAGKFENRLMVLKNMPPAGFAASDEDKGMIVAWARAGAPRGATPPPVEVSAGTVTKVTAGSPPKELKDVTSSASGPNSPAAEAPKNVTPTPQTDVAVEKKSMDPEKERLINIGRDLYKTKGCFSCHGDNADGKSAMAAAFPTKPRSFIGDEQFKNGDNVEQIAKTIETGLAPFMPSFSGQFSDEERIALATFIKSLSGDKETAPEIAPETVTEPTPTPKPVKKATPKKKSTVPQTKTTVAPQDSGGSQKTKQLISVGRSLFKTKGCFSCHGDNGDGKSPMAASLPIKPRSFWGDETFKNGNSVVQIAKTIETGLPPLMPAYAGQLSGDERAALAAFIKSLNKSAK